MGSQLILSQKKSKSYYKRKIRIKSPAKINLYLNILGKYPDGYHRLESVVERISLFDTLQIETQKNPSIEISSNIKSLEAHENIVYKTAHLCRRILKIPFGFKISLEKNIPIGSGLGGGSSNAASFLIGLNNLLNLGLKKTDLYCLGKKVGSDVNFFISESRFALFRERGEDVEPLEINKSLHHLIIWPKINVSTKKVYENCRVKLTKFFNNVNILKYALVAGDKLLIKKSVFNALENQACSLYPGLSCARERIRKENIFARLTGSGSAFYTVFCDMPIAAVKESLPGDWDIFYVKTF